MKTSPLFMSQISLSLPSVRSALQYVLVWLLALKKINLCAIHIILGEGQILIDALIIKRFGENMLF